MCVCVLPNPAEGARGGLRQSRTSRDGFSLVELLVVIAVIGIMSAVAIPNLARVSQSARINKDQRNAQSISSAAGAAQAAGAQLDLSSIDNAINQLKEGIPGDGAFANSVFRVAPFGQEEIESMRPYLSIAGTTIVYQQP